MKIGIVGAGKIGSTMAKLWVDAGHDVRLSSRRPEELSDLVARLGPRASAGTPEEAANFGEVVMLTVPLKALPDVVKEVGDAFKGKIVLDTGNVYAQRDGDVARIASADPKGSSAWAATLFPGSRWVKALNTVNYKPLASEAHRKENPIGIPLASDDTGALDVASQLIKDAGFDPVVVGPLARGKEFEPGTKPYNTGMSGSELRKIFAPSV